VPPEVVVVDRVYVGRELVFGDPFEDTPLGSSRVYLLSKGEFLKLNLKGTNYMRICL
jgi:hypothetical protein